MNAGRFSQTDPSGQGIQTDRAERCGCGRMLLIVERHPAANAGQLPIGLPSVAWITTTLGRGSASSFGQVLIGSS